MKILFYLAVISYVCAAYVSAAAYNDENEDIPEICRLEPRTGRCYASIPKFYYSTNIKQCIPFIYGGCDGNGNQFDTKEECERTCLRSDYLTSK